MYESEPGEWRRQCRRVLQDRAWVRRAAPFPASLGDVPGFQAWCDEISVATAYLVGYPSLHPCTQDDEDQLLLELNVLMYPMRPFQPLFLLFANIATYKGILK